MFAHTIRIVINGSVRSHGVYKNDNYPRRVRIPDTDRLLRFKKKTKRVLSVAAIFGCAVKYKIQCLVSFFEIYQNTEISYSNIGRQFYERLNVFALFV